MPNAIPFMPCQYIINASSSDTHIICCLYVMLIVNDNYKMAAYRWHAKSNGHSIGQCPHRKWKKCPHKKWRTNLVCSHYCERERADFRKKKELNSNPVTTNDNYKELGTYFWYPWFFHSLIITPLPVALDSSLEVLREVLITTLSILIAQYGCIS